MNFRMDYTKLEKRKKKKDIKKLANQKTADKPISIYRKKVVVTGTVAGMTRSQIGRWLSRYNAELQTTVSISTDYLIVGDTKGLTTTKITKANNLRIPIIKPIDIKEFVQWEVVL